MSAEVAVTPSTDLAIEQMARIDQRIDSHEGEALRDRWEFGRHMLAARDGAGRLPNGYLSALVGRTGKSRAELKFRAQFAATYATEAELANALASSNSWRGIVATLKKAKDAEDNIISAPEPAAGGLVGTIVADPPWSYGNTSTRGAAENHYRTMSIEELCDLGVARERAAAQSHLYLWSTAGHLSEAFKVMAAWGFTYKTYLVWVKPQMGMGNYFRVSTELVLFGVKGGLRTTERNIKNYFTEPRQKHSAKPLSFQDIVARTSPGPYLELFARCQKDGLFAGCQKDGLFAGCLCSKCRLGWETWGNQS
ncbi:MAG: MT-A70 family methyltransferase [Mycobacteriales bacterium]